MIDSKSKKRILVLNDGMQILSGYPGPYIKISNLNDAEFLQRNLSVKFNVVYVTCNSERANYGGVEICFGAAAVPSILQKMIDEI